MTGPNGPQDTQALSAAAGATGLAAHAAALQSILTDLSTLTVSQLVALFRRYQNAPDFLDVLKAAFPQIVLPHANAAAEVTAQWYSELDPASRFTATPTVNLPGPRLDKTLAWSLWAPTENMPQSDSGTQTMVPPEVTLSRLAGSTKRMVFDASRDTVTANADKQGIKYARYASANACAFCRLLAQRGAVYRSQDSALYVVGRGADMSEEDQAIADQGGTRRTGGQFIAKGRKTRGTQEIGEKFHDHCRCVVVAVPDGETYTPPDYVNQWKQDYRAAFKAVPDGTSYRDGKVLKMVLAHMREHTDAH